MPYMISPPNAKPPPPDSVLIQLGFNASLPYEFIAFNTDVVSQIFTFMPLGVSYAVEIDKNQTPITGIGQYDRGTKKGYTTALVFCYIPNDVYKLLATSLTTPQSRLYTNPDQSTFTLMSMIDSSIPLLAGGQPVPGGGTAPYPGGLPGSGNNGGNGDGTDGDENKGKGPGGSAGATGIKPTAVGIGLGVVGGAALYGAAMFFVARRYRKKRNLHRRSDSLTSGMGSPTPYHDEQRAGSPFAGTTMNDRYSGAGSGRTAQISAPVMAENSLGWN